MRLSLLTHGWRSATWVFRWFGDVAWVYDGPHPDAVNAALRVTVHRRPVGIEIHPLDDRYSGPVPLGVWEQIVAWVQERTAHSTGAANASSAAVDWSKFELPTIPAMDDSGAGRGGFHN